MGGLWWLAGAVAGSVANSIIYRWPRRLAWIADRSRCPKCKHVLAGWDLLPLLSFVFLRGKCRYCRQPIGWRYLIVELVMAIGFGYLGNLGDLSVLGIWWITVVIAAIDWETRLVPEVLVAGWALLSLGNLSRLSVLGVLGGAAVIGAMWGLSRGRAMGFGDVEIAAVLGWWLGWPGIIWALWVAFVVGGLIGLISLIRRMGTLKSQIAFGPFLVGGGWVAYFWGDKMRAWFLGF